MAFITGGKHFGQYTYEHWYDDEYGDDPKPGAIMLNGEIPENPALENIENAPDSRKETE